MSWGLRASILIAADTHTGQWCPVAWIANRLSISREAVQNEAELLVEAGLLQAGLIDGVPCYGVRVDVRSELVS